MAVSTEDGLVLASTGLSTDKTCFKIAAQNKGNALIINHIKKNRNQSKQLIIYFSFDKKQG
ncbi:MAG: hypothetical protein ACJ75B_11815 [Flavisolibacter sp.]